MSQQRRNNPPQPNQQPPNQQLPQQLFTPVVYQSYSSVPVVNQNYQYSNQQLPQQLFTPVVYQNYPSVPVGNQSNAITYNQQPQPIAIHINNMCSVTSVPIYTQQQNNSYQQYPIPILPPIPIYTQQSLQPTTYNNTISQPLHHQFPPQNNNFGNQFITYHNITSQPNSSQVNNNYIGSTLQSNQAVPMQASHMAPTNNYNNNVSMPVVPIVQPYIPQHTKRAALLMNINNVPSRAWCDSNSFIEHYFDIYTRLGVSRHNLWSMMTIAEFDYEEMKDVADKAKNDDQFAACHINKDMIYMHNFQESGKHILTLMNDKYYKYKDKPYAEGILQHVGFDIIEYFKNAQDRFSGYKFSVDAALKCVYTLLYVIHFVDYKQLIFVISGIQHIVNKWRNRRLAKKLGQETMILYNECIQWKKDYKKAEDQVNNAMIQNAFLAFNTQQMNEMRARLKIHLKKTFNIYHSLLNTSNISRYAQNVNAPKIELSGLNNDALHPNDECEFIIIAYVRDSGFKLSKQDILGILIQHYQDIANLPGGPQPAPFAL